MVQFDEKFFVATATILFVAIVFKPLKAVINALIDGKIASVKKQLEEAKNLREQAQKLLQEAEDRLAQTEKDAVQILEHAKSEAENIVKTTREKLSKDIEVRKSLALQKIASIEENAVNEIKRNISGMTVLAAQTILEENLDEDSFKKLVEGSLEKISRTVH